MTWAGEGRGGARAAAWAGEGRVAAGAATWMGEGREVAGAAAWEAPCSRQQPISRRSDSAADVLRQEGHQNSRSQKLSTLATAGGNRSAPGRSSRR